MVDLLPDEGKELQYLVLHLFLDIDFVNLLELVAPLVKGLVLFLEPSVNLLGDLRHEDWLLSVDVSLIDALLAEGLPLVRTLSSLERYDWETMNSANFIIISGLFLLLGQDLEW